jgi:hypothetical protein
MGWQWAVLFEGTECFIQNIGLIRMMYYFEQYRIAACE